MARQLTRVILKVVSGVYEPDTGHTVTLQTDEGSPVLVATATETPAGSANYVATWVEQEKYGFWYVDGGIKTEWGRVWLGSVVGNINYLTNFNVAGTLSVNGAFDLIGLMTIDNSNLVTNLNADQLDGQHADAFLLVNNTGSINHANLQNLSFATAGHTGFAGIGVTNQFTHGQQFQAGLQVTGSVNIRGSIAELNLFSIDWNSGTIITQYSGINGGRAYISNPAGVDLLVNGNDAFSVNSVNVKSYKPLEVIGASQFTGNMQVTGSISLTGDINMSAFPSNIEMQDFTVVRNTPRTNYMSLYDGTYGSVHLFASQGGITLNGGAVGTRVVGGNFGIGITGTPTSTLHVSGSIAFVPTTLLTGAYAVVGTDSILLSNAISGSIDITLPSAASFVGRQLTIKKIDASLNLVNVSGSSGQLIDGQIVQSIATQYTSMTIVSDGSAWFII